MNVSDTELFRFGTDVVRGLRELCDAKDARIRELEAALRKIADDDCIMLFQDVAAIALGCTCTDYHRRKLITDPECPFHCD